jgi:hypothetical protein
MTGEGSAERYIPIGAEEEIETEAPRLELVPDVGSDDEDGVEPERVAYLKAMQDRDFEEAERVAIAAYGEDSTQVKVARSERQRSIAKSE